MPKVCNPPMLGILCPPDLPSRISEVRCLGQTNVTLTRQLSPWSPDCHSQTGLLRGMIGTIMKGKNYFYICYKATPI